jgi:fucose permease
LVTLGLLTACTTLGEGAAADWGALFLHDERGASESTAALGYAVFCCAMAIGRFGGTWVLSHIARVWALRWSGVAVSASLAVLVAIDVIPVSLVAMAGWGFGVAIVFPAAMSAAAEQAARPAHGIAVVSTIGYGGFLVGPPLIGFLAGHVGLGVALWVVAALGAVLFVLSTSAAPRHRRAEPTSDDEQPLAAEFLRV